MMQSTDNLKLIIDVASEKGAMQERCMQLELKNNQLSAENAQLKEHLQANQEVLRIREERIRELEKMQTCLYIEDDKLLTDQKGQPKVVVNQYLLLDKPKTFNYVCSLDAAHRMFAGHMLMHTMPDCTPKQIYDQVTEMTQLAANPSERLANALEKVVEQPKTENIYGDLVMRKTVEKEVNGVAAGGTGVSIYKEII